MKTLYAYALTGVTSIELVPVLFGEGISAGAREEIGKAVNEIMTAVGLLKREEEAREELSAAAGHLEEASYRRLTPRGEKAIEEAVGIVSVVRLELGYL